MKHILSILLLAISFSSLAQSPNAFNYQAVVRDGGGMAVTNQNVGFRIAILQGGATGAIVYQESFSPTTNTIGLASVLVGTGTVLNGSFASIDWSNGPYFIQVAVDPSGGTAYAVMGTSQLVSVPYALNAKTADNVFSGDYNDLTNIPAVGAGNTLDMAYDQGGAGAGRVIAVDAGEIEINATMPNGNGLLVQNATATGTAIKARSLNSSVTFSALQAETSSNSNQASAVVGNTTGAAFAVVGQVSANATAQTGIYGSNLRPNGGHGVHGIGFNGVVGETNYSSGNAVFGENYDTEPPLGNGIGVAGTGYWGVVGEDRYLGGVTGAYGVLSNGDFGATGAKLFIIDHPADPANKFLKHFSSESNEVLNIYRGNVTFAANGEAVVTMPDYYHLINRNPSYQLTPIGGPAQLFIKEKLEGGQFVIGGGTAGMEASWTVYAERNDPYLHQNPEKREVEVEKREGQKGKYFMPQLYNEPMNKKMIRTSENATVKQPVLQIQE